jgi:L-aspartate oxidase
MGSNSLLEGMVLGEIAGRNAAFESENCIRQRPARILRRTLDDAPSGIELGISDLLYSMKSLMWRQVGLERNATLLDEALEHLTFWFDATRRLAPAEPRAWELVNMLTVANLATIGADKRQESRGVHYRTDYQKISDPYHTLISPIKHDDHCVSSKTEHITSSNRLTSG